MSIQIPYFEQPMVVNYRRFKVDVYHCWSILSSSRSPTDASNGETAKLQRTLIVTWFFQPISLQVSKQRKTQKNIHQ